MKLYSILILEKKGEKQETKNDGYDLSHVSFFSRSTVREFIVFYSKTVAEHIQNSKICVTEKEYKMCAENKNNLTIVVTTDREYLDRAAFSIIDAVWREMNNNIDLNKMLEKYQDPCAADKIMKVQRDIDSAKLIMLDSVDKVLQRGQSLDQLISKSQDLSDSSKMFYQDTKKMNSCCVIA